LPAAHSITSSARAKYRLRHRQAERLRGLTVVGDFGGEGANASSLVDDYRADTEWFPAQIPIGYMPSTFSTASWT